MDKSSPAISIITPTFNRSHELDYLIESINNQTLDHKYFEMIISDDGSTDGTDKKIKKWSNVVDFKLKYICQNNLGPGAARNHGVINSLGELIVFIDSDCEANENWLKIIYDSYKNNLFDAFGGPDHSKNDFLPIQIAIDYSMTSFLTTGGMRGHKKNMLAKFYPRSHNMGLKKTIFEKVGGFGALRHGQDIELSHRILNSGARVELLIDAIVYHRRRTTLKKFFRQVFNWGVARVNLGKIDNAMLEPIHFIPSAATLFALLTLFGLGLAPNIFYLIIVFGFASILLVSLFGGIKNRSISVMLLLLLVVPVQIFGYGLGFMVAYFKRFILDHDEFTGFQKKYY
jgi:glycosyltransferase involved in cell wall biosynthesis